MESIANYCKEKTMKKKTNIKNLKTKAMKREIRRKRRTKKMFLRNEEDQKNNNEEFEKKIQKYV